MRLKRHFLLFPGDNFRYALFWFEAHTHSIFLSSFQKHTLLTEHSDAVSALDVVNGKLVSGSWDTNIKVSGIWYSRIQTVLVIERESIFGYRNSILNRMG